MNTRGLVLIGFSALCLLTAGLAHDKTEKRALSQRLAAISEPVRACMREGITTSGGRVGCFQPVSAAIGRTVFGQSYGGGSAMSRR